MKNSVKYILIILSVGAFIVSIFLPAFETGVTYLIEERMYEKGKIYDGIEVLTWGWLGIISGVIGWYANIGFIISLVLAIHKNIICVFVSFVSLIIAISSLTHPVISSDNGVDHFISQYLLGCYWWMSAHALIFITCIYMALFCFDNKKAS
jgi:hypothetical protein